MQDTRLRAFKDRLGESVAIHLTGISPNTITLLAFAFGIFAALVTAQGQFLWALALWLLNRLFDLLDGLVARTQNKKSDFGGYLDILLDFAVYAALPIALVFSQPSLARYAALAFMLATFYVNSASWMYLAAILEKRNSANVPMVAASMNLTTIIMPAGLIGAVETFFAYCAFLLLLDWIEVLYVGFGVLVLVTVAQRLIWARRTLR